MNYKNFKGKFFAIEGTDGSGKTEQTKWLINNLKKLNLKVKILDFPQYGKPSAYFVEEYLRGKYGGLKDIGAYKASLFYALDRFQKSAEIKKWLKDGYCVISNRYVASNIGHQGAKLQGKEREKFIQWIYNLEYNVLEIPKPNINFFLHMPVEISYKLIENKKEREYLCGKKRDIHEENLEHLRAARESYLVALKSYPDDFIKIDCMKNKKLLSIKEIAGIIWNKISKN